MVAERRKKEKYPRLKGSKRAPKSEAQKRKISEAIAAKWADPEYQTRVYSGLDKYHGIPEGAEWKPKRKPSGDGQTRNKGHMKKDEDDDVAKRKTKSQNQQIRSKRRRAPLYKDPLSSTKLEMLKNIRAQRAAVGDPKTEAVTKAKLLIAEAEKAAKALEVAAKTSPLAHASLMKSRMLIAEAHKLIESIEIEDANTFVEDDNESDLSEAVPDLENNQNLDPKKPKKVNGLHSISVDLEEENDSFSFDEFIFADFINGNGSSPYPLETEETGTNGFVSSGLDNMMMNGSDSTKHYVERKPTPNGISVCTQNPAINRPELHSEKVEEAKKDAKVIKKRVRGRLVEVEAKEEEEA